MLASARAEAMPTLASPLPPAGSAVADAVDVSIAVSSPYVLTSVTATIGGTTKALTASAGAASRDRVPCQPGNSITRIGKTTLVKTTLVANAYVGASGIASIRTWGGYVYWYAALANAIVRVPSNGGAMQVMVSPSSYDFVVDATSIYLVPGGVAPNTLDGRRRTGSRRAIGGSPAPRPPSERPPRTRAARSTPSARLAHRRRRRAPLLGRQRIRRQGEAMTRGQPLLCGP
jgi:hypothetical protein